MLLKNKILNQISRIALVNKYFTGNATIFTLHRVSPFESGKLSVNENMKVSPEFLESFIVDLLAKDYKFISIDRLYEVLKSQEIVKKNVVLTFDDGYKDNYGFAYPILKKYNIPFTIYITTSLPEMKAILWWYVLEDIIINNDKVVLSNNEEYLCKTNKQKISSFIEIRKKIMHLNPNSFLKDLDLLLVNYAIDWKGKCEELAISWSQIQELSKDKLVTIAGHTKNHFPLNKLTISNAKLEILEANKLIESKIGRLVNHLAYPFGGHSEINHREIEIVKSLNLKTAVTTRNGNIFLEHKNFIESLPRIMLTEKFKIQDIGRIKRRRVATL
jgi:peptidoglycan/xylan/chitin deacetylase (PgdA/CDA1 family)